MPKLWFDDIRYPPDDSWLWARTIDEAKTLCLTENIVEASLDHDLGLHEYDPYERDADLRRVPRRYKHYDCGSIQPEGGLNREPASCRTCEVSTEPGEWSKIPEPDGVEFAEWLVAEDLVPTKVILHSMNPVGRRKMRDILAGKALHIVEQEFDPSIRGE